MLLADTDTISCVLVARGVVLRASRRLFES